MRNLCVLIGMTYGEFQSWYSYGEIRLGVGRFVHIEMHKNSAPDPESPYAAILFERTPQLRLEDEEGILLVQLRPTVRDESWSAVAGIDAGTIHVPIERIQRVIPLTDRARRILKPRMEPLGIQLATPYFQEPAHDAWFRMGLCNALRGGDALIDMLFESGATAINKKIKCAVEEGIRKMDHQGKMSLDRTDSSWVSYAYDFTRHDPYDKGDIGYLYDAGFVLRSCADRLGMDKNVLENYRNATKEIGKRIDATVPLYVFVADRRLIDAATETAVNYADAFPASLVSLILFLRWKDLFHKNSEEVDFQGLIDDSSRFVKSAGFEQTVIAVWLLGCFAGFERIAPNIYGSNPEKHTWFSGNTLQVKKLRKPEAESTPRSEQEASSAGEESQSEDGGAATGVEETPALSADSPSPTAAEEAPTADEAEEQTEAPQDDPETDTDTIESATSIDHNFEATHEASQSPSEEETTEAPDEEVTEAPEEVTEAHQNQFNQKKLRGKEGCLVGFYMNQHKQYGEIVKLNPKTVKIHTKFGIKDRVKYSALFKVMDREDSQIKDAWLIEGEVVADPVQPFIFQWDER